MTNLKLNQTRGTKIKRTQQPTVHNGLLGTRSFYFWFTSYIWRVVYILLLVYVLPERRNSSSRFWLLSCMPLPSTPTLEYLVSLNMPRAFRNKRGCWIFFILMAKQKVGYFFQEDSGWFTLCECVSMPFDSPLHTGCYSSHVFVCHKWTAPALLCIILHPTARGILVEATLPVPVITLTSWVPQGESGLLLLWSCSKDLKSP